MATFGLTGLATMGANLARNIARNGFEIVVHNRTTERLERFLDEHGDEGPITGARSLEELVGKLERPRTVMVMVKAGDARRRRDRGAGAAARRGRHDRRRRQQPLPRLRAPRRGAVRARPAVPRRGRQRRGGGRAQRPLDHARRRRGRLPRRRGDPHHDRRPGRRDAVLHLRRPRRRGPLREDGPQRHRVRRHAADRRGLRPAPRGRRDVARRDRRHRSASGTRARSSRS